MSFHEVRANQLLNSVFGEALREHGVSKHALMQISKTCLEHDNAAFPNHLPKSFKVFSLASSYELVSYDFDTTDGAHANLVTSLQTLESTPYSLHYISEDSIDVHVESAAMRVLSDFRFRGIQVLAFSETMLGVDDLTNIFDALGKSQVTTLVLQNCGLTDTCAVALFHRIGETKLLSLDLTNNMIEDEGLHLFASALQRDECLLQEIQLSFNQFTIRALNKLLDAMKSPTCKLNTLILDYSVDEGIMLLHGESLKMSSLRHVLELGRLNTLRISLLGSHLSTLQEALQHSYCQLTSLHIHLYGQYKQRLTQFLPILKRARCPLADFGIYGSVMDATMCNRLIRANEAPTCKLVSLGLINCSLNPTCLSMFVDMLKSPSGDTSKNLSKLNLTGNPFNDMAAVDFASALRHVNCYVEQIDVDDDGLSNEGLQVFYGAQNAMRVARLCLTLCTAREIARFGHETTTPLAKLPREACIKVAEMLI